jgi:hypothetical protein
MSHWVDTYHKDHFIHASADLDRQCNKWIWRALIAWQENGGTKYHTLYGSLHEGDESREEAIADGIALSIRWIEDGKPNVKK